MSGDRSMTGDSFRRRLEEAFYRADAPEVFHSVAHRHEIWKEDPFDVETIHAEAREVFERMVHRATTPPGTSSGRIILLLGESGSGKTHLLRAFRNSVHSRGVAYLGYLQMSSGSVSYGRYILRNLIESLDQPFFGSHEPRSGLFRLSTALAEACPARVRLASGASLALAQALAEEGSSPEGVMGLVRQAAEAMVALPSYRRIDIDLISSLLCLQAQNPLLQNLVLKYLRCEDLSETQRRQLGGMAPKVRDEDPLHLVEQLGRLMWATGENVMVLCLDQLEDIYVLEDARAQFRRVMTAVREVADNVPSSIVVISCLKDYYEKLRGELTRSLLDRIERDPEPIELKSSRTLEEVRLLVEYRLRFLYESLGIDATRSWPPEVPRLHPFGDGELEALAHLRTRDVLDWCREFRNRRGPAPGAVEPAASPPGEIQQSTSGGSAVVPIEQAWNDLLAGETSGPPEDEEALAGLLARALERCGRELDDTPHLSATVRGNHIFLNGWREPLAVGLCNRSPAGGGLRRQIETLEEDSAGRRVVIARSTEYPRSPRTQIANLLGELIARGGRRVVVQDSEWRAMAALDRFEEAWGGERGFEDWLRAEHPLLRLNSIQVILGIAGPSPSLVTAARAGGEGGSTAPSAPMVEPIREGVAGPLRAATLERLPEAQVIIPGQTDGRLPRTIEIGLSELTRHLAFLGGSGTGKTTAAMTCIEQLLLLGIPAILVDRKGDLCGYADPGCYDRLPEDAERAETLSRLREAVEVVLYTPGDPRGRPLAIPVIPAGAHSLPDIERDQLTGYSAAALAAMMGYGERSASQRAQAAILKCALAVLCRSGGGSSPAIDDVVDLLHERDPLLLNELGHLDRKLCDRLVGDLETLRLTKGHLLRPEGEVLDVGKILGAGSRRPGKVRLTVISTKFLGSARDIEFWMAQFLVAVGRWISGRPAANLQAVLLLDEADLYLPANSKPATKDPLESLLKRARSAGLGLFLATQSPGDLDYKCRDNIRTWILGRIKEPTALAKVKPMLSEAHEDAHARLPTLEPGRFFLVRDGRVERIRARWSALSPEQLPEERILELARGTANV